MESVVGLFQGVAEFSTCFQLPSWRRWFVLFSHRKKNIEKLEIEEFLLGSRTLVPVYRKTPEIRGVKPVWFTKDLHRNMIFLHSHTAVFTLNGEGKQTFWKMNQSWWQRRLMMNLGRWFSRFLWLSVLGKYGFLGGPRLSEVFRSRYWFSKRLLYIPVDGWNPANHLGCIQPCKSWDKLSTNWCRISSINIFGKDEVQTWKTNLTHVESRVWKNAKEVHTWSSFIWCSVFNLQLILR